MKSVKTNHRFSLQELLEFFRPHSFRLPTAVQSKGANAYESNVVPIHLPNLIKELSAPKIATARVRTVRHVRKSSYASVETLAAIYRGDDVISGAVLQSRHCQTAPPFLVRNDSLNSMAGSFHYEVWAFVESAPTDPALLLELCASAEALGESIGRLPKFVRVAVIGGPVLDYETRPLLLMYERIKQLFLDERPAQAQVRKTSISSLDSFRLGKDLRG